MVGSQCKKYPKFTISVTADCKIGIFGFLLSSKTEIVLQIFIKIKKVDDKTKQQNEQAGDTSNYVGIQKKKMIKRGVCLYQLSAKVRSSLATLKVGALPTKLLLRSAEGFLTQIQNNIGIIFLSVCKNSPPFI